MNANTLAVNVQASREYLVSRKADTEALVAQGITSLPYVAVKGVPGKGVLVGDVLCASTLCAVAYILAKWW